MDISIMEKTVVNVKKLTASQGMVHTNGEVYGRVIYLGCNDSPKNWYEISEEEATELQTADEDQANV